jgi:arylformamidase
MSRRRVIDVSATLREPMRGFRKTVAKTVGTDGWYASTLEIYSHAGTHLDAPLHYEVNTSTIDEIPVERLICDCHIVRIDPCEPALMITMEHLGPVADLILPGEGIIFHTGWSRYIDDTTMFRDRLPRISKDLANWMVHRKVNLVGVEPPSVADVNNIEEVTVIHRILMEGDVLILEGLCNLGEVIQNKVQLIALPLKIGGGDGAPARAVIVET